MGTSTLCPRASPQHTRPHQLDQREHGLTLPGVASIPRVQLARGPPGLPFLLSEVGWALVGGSPPERLKALPGTALTPHLDACWRAPRKTSPVALTATPSGGVCSLYFTGGEFGAWQASLAPGVHSYKWQRELGPELGLGALNC